MIAPVVDAILVMMAAAEPIAPSWIATPRPRCWHSPSSSWSGWRWSPTASTVHIERGFIYAAMVFAGAVDSLNLWRGQERRPARRAARTEAAQPSAESMTAG